MNENMTTLPSKIVEDNITAASGKTVSPIWKIVIMGIMAGMFIAFGASASSAAVHNVSDVGIAKTVAGCIFPVGLMMIILVGGELFTGDCMMIMGVLDKKYSLLSMAKVLALVFFSNMIGSIIIAALINISGQLNYTEGALAAYTIKTAYGKAGIAFGTALSSGILCNIIVCVAVIMAAASRTAIGKLFGAFFPILAFVISGYEHCVANMYYIPAGIFASMNPDYAAKASELYGLTNLPEVLNWKNFFFTNLIPVTLGNMIGGMVFVGLPLFILHRKNGQVR